MLWVSLGALSVAVLLGMALAVMHVRPGGGRVLARVGLLHGGVGALGVAAMLVALRQSVLGALGWDAVALLTAALLGGGTYYVLARRGRPPGLLLVLHGALAFIGYVLLAGYLGTQ